MAFTEKVINLAIGRQNGKCGDCGIKLKDVLFDAHHLKRQQDGGSDDLDNCVILCSRNTGNNCHHAAHNHGNYRQAIQLSPSQFRYFNG